MKPTQEYGYRLLSCGEIIQTGDEYLSDDGQWKSRNDCGKGQTQGAGWFPTRRKIEAGYGYELVSPNDLVRNGDEYLDGFSGTEWRVALCVGEVAREAVSTAYRRRITKSEWIDISVSHPSYGQRIWINHNDLGVIFTIYKGAAKHWTHWREVKPGEIPEPPKQPKQYLLARSVEEMAKFIRDPNIVWYGPHECEHCGEIIVKSSHESGGVSLDRPHDAYYPNHAWKLHKCGGRK